MELSWNNECGGCGLQWDGAHEFGCDHCRRLYPEALLKAAADEFDYVLQLKNHTTIRFIGAEFNGGDFVHLRRRSEDYNGQPADDGMEYPCPRGIDVRISEIVWVADAPEGS